MATLTTTVGADFVVPAASPFRVTVRGAAHIEAKTAAGDYLKLRGGPVRDEAVDVSNSAAGATYRVVNASTSPAVIEVSQ